MIGSYKIILWCYRLFVCLFVCLGFIVPLENFSLIWRRHWRRAANFDLCSALMVIEKGFFSVPHLQWHGAFVYNGHLRGPVTLTPIAERLAVELSLLTTYFYDLGLSRLRFEHPNFRLRGQCSNPLRHRRGLKLLSCIMNKKWSAGSSHLLISINVIWFFFLDQIQNNSELVYMVSYYIYMCI